MFLFLHILCRQCLSFTSSLHAPLHSESAKWQKCRRTLSQQEEVTGQNSRPSCMSTATAPRVCAKDICILKLLYEDVLLVQDVS